jgi:hypothetical protein
MTNTKAIKLIFDIFQCSESQKIPNNKVNGLSKAEELNEILIAYKSNK